MEEPVLRSRLLPQLSIRSILGLTFVMAILAAIARSAGAGEEAAKAFLFAASAVMAYFAISVLLFLLARTTDLLFPNAPTSRSRTKTLLGIVCHHRSYPQGIIEHDHGSK